MSRKALLVVLSCALGVSGFLLKSKAASGGKHGPTVQVAVQATDASGAALHYKWKASDGVLTDVDAATTSWTLPAGPGLHFAYVLVSNGLGGYTERRLGINTDNFSNGIANPLPVSLSAPAAPAQQGDYYRSYVTVGEASEANGDNHYVYSPDVAVYVQDQNNASLRYPASESVLTDLKGEFTIPGVPAGNYSVYCSVQSGTAFDCTSANGTAAMLTDASGNPVATTGYAEPGGNSNSPATISGSVTLADLSPCGTSNEFFGVTSAATATLLDGSGATLQNVRVNAYGDYALIADPNGASVRLQCEGATVTVPVPALDSAGYAVVPPATIAGVSTPNVTGMSATLHGVLLNGTSALVALFLPPHTQFPGDTPPTDFPSNIMARNDGFLAVKGLDTRVGACQYYKAVGAVKGCDAAGGLIGAISFTDWKKAVKIGPFAVNAVPTYTASYINAVDLNLTRVHKSISYGPNQTAAVVCNHLGVPITTAADFLAPAQSEIDAAVSNAVHNKNLVACVAMDYTITPGVNNNQPFVRFLIFGPGGQLLPSVNLDERREKFVPGTCVVCHGGDHYAGKYPEDGSGPANVGGHFLPYDAGNFEFSSAAVLTKCAQENAIYHLNQNVLNAGATPAEVALINGWYAKGVSKCGNNKVHALDEAYVAPSWQGISQQATDFYSKVNARSCRTCHVALPEAYNFEHSANVTPGGFTNQLPSVDDDLRITLCGGSPQFGRDHMMANSLNTFNRFWLSDVPTANTSGLPNQSAAFTAYYNNTDTSLCAVSPGTTP